MHHIIVSLLHLLLNSFTAATVCFRHGVHAGACIAAFHGSIALKLSDKLPRMEEASELCAHTSLQKLHLGNNRIGPEGARALAPQVASLISLQELGLKGGRHIDSEEILKPHLTPLQWISLRII